MPDRACITRPLLQEHVTIPTWANSDIHNGTQVTGPARENVHKVGGLVTLRALSRLVAGQNRHPKGRV